MSTRRDSSLAAIGLMAGTVTAVIAATLAPQFPVSALDLFARAVLLLGLVFAAAFITTYAGFSRRGDARRPQAWKISLGVAVNALWVLPLMMFAMQQSWLVVILWAVFLFHIARFLGSLQNQSNEPSPTPRAAESPAFAVLKRDFRYANTILGALLLQSALFAVVSGHDVLAGLFYLCGTAALAYRTFQMFRAVPDLNTGTRERIVPVLGTVTLLTLFAWLPSISITGSSSGGLNGAGGGPLAAGNQSASRETGKRVTTRQTRATTLDWLRSLLPLPRSNSHPDSFAFAKRIYDVKFPPATVQAETGTSERHKTGIPNREPVIGPVFPGVELYPEGAHRTKLVAPPPQRSSGIGAAHSEPVSIPFDGVYRFWKGPGEGPPPNVVVMHGSPSARFFRSTDHEIMSMEAHENLGFSVDPRVYGAIEIVLENVDPFPNTVSIALRVRNSAVSSRPAESLGIERVLARSGASGSHDTTVQTLRFSIPARSGVGKFDELVVTYYLMGDRSDRSARIAIRGFRLVPRAG